MADPSGLSTEGRLQGMTESGNHCGADAMFLFVAALVCRSLDSLERCDLTQVDLLHT